MRILTNSMLSILLLVPCPVWAQGIDAAPPRFGLALEQLAGGDTLTALAALREVTVNQPEYGPAWLRLGALLSARATEVEVDFAGRLEARDVLARAVQLLPGDPVALLEYGLLLRKQQIRHDAKRVLERAWKAAEKRGEALAPLDRARLHYELGRIYETWWLDWEDLIMIPPTAQGGWSCPNLGGVPLETERLGTAFATFAVACPHNWRTVLERTVPQADFKSEEHARMLDHFRLAHAADPGFVPAGTALLSHLVTGNAWDEYEAVAARMEAAAPDDGRVHLFRGLGLHERGRSEAADSAFTRALELLPPQDRRVFEDVGELLPKSADSAYATLDDAARRETARRVFVARDPLYMTRTSERQLEHYSRLAWAELKFGAPANGLRGWDTERGQIWVRYGRPELHRQCCYSERGRWSFWSYGDDGPNFAFQRNLTYRLAFMNEAAKRVADELEERAPELYRPNVISRTFPVPHQIARFRGASDDLVRVELYANVATDSLEVPSGGEIDAGLFVFDSHYNQIWAPRSRRPERDALHLGYSFGLTAGSYTYAIEARSVASDTLARPLARARGTVDAVPFAPGRLAVSDILLAESIGTAAPAPESRKDVRITARRSTVVPADQPLHLYFEIYGLSADADGIARVRTELAVEDATQRNIARRLLRGVDELIRGTGDDPTIRWEREVRISRDQALEFISVELAAHDPGDYRLRIRVTDLATGRQAETVRPFAIAP